MESRTENHIEFINMSATTHQVVGEVTSWVLIILQQPKCNVSVHKDDARSHIYHIDSKLGSHGTPFHT